MPANNNDIEAEIAASINSVVSKRETLDEYQLEYQAILSRLPAEIAESFTADGDQTSQDLDLPVSKWCLCDNPEGDYPAVYAYSKLFDLLKAIALRAGKETSISVFYGLPLAIFKSAGTEGTDFYLKLPNQTAVKVNKNGELVVCDMADLAEDDNINMLERGWMGDDSFLSSQYFKPGVVDVSDNDNYLHGPDDKNDDDFHPQ